MRYGYRCPYRGPITSLVRADWVLCPACNEVEMETEAKRDWKFHLDYSFQPYFAPSFGTVVNSRSHAKDLAKLASEEATRRLGYDHNFQVVDTHDDAAVGIDTAAKEAEMENTRRYAVNGAAWSAERRNEIDAEKARVTAERRIRAEA